MDWRTWAYDRLRLDASILTDVPETSIFGAGSLSGSPQARPFIVLRFGAETVELVDGDKPAATSHRMTVYAHDKPGDYLRVARILRNVRTLLAGNVTGMAPGNGIMAVWEGDSGDLADDLFQTVVRYGEYRLIGKVA